MRKGFTAGIVASVQLCSMARALETNPNRSCRRFTFRVERSLGQCGEVEPLGVAFRGLGQVSAPLVIEEIQPTGLIDVTNKVQAAGSDHWRVLQPGDRVVSVNGCTQEGDAVMLEITLSTDRGLLFVIERDDYEPWHGRNVRDCGMRRLAMVDPRTVRFTHDIINSVFRNGNSVDFTIGCMLDGSLTPEDFPPIEVSLGAMKRCRSGRRR